MDGENSRRFFSWSCQEWASDWAQAAVHGPVNGRTRGGALALRGSVKMRGQREGCGITLRSWR